MDQKEFNAAAIKLHKLFLEEQSKRDFLLLPHEEEDDIHDRYEAVQMLLCNIKSLEPDWAKRVKAIIEVKTPEKRSMIKLVESLIDATK